MKEDHPAYKNCVVLLFAYIVIRKLHNLPQSDDQKLKTFLRSEEVQYDFSGATKSCSLAWLVDTVQRLDNSKYQVFFIIDYCQVWIHIPDRMRNITAPKPHEILKDKELRLQTLYYAAVNIA